MEVTSVAAVTAGGLTGGLGGPRSELCSLVMIW